jgi:hypothetical protein
VRRAVAFLAVFLSCSAAFVAFLIYGKPWSGPFISFLGGWQVGAFVTRFARWVSGTEEAA